MRGDAVVFLCALTLGGLALTVGCGPSDSGLVLDGPAAPGDVITPGPSVPMGLVRIVVKWPTADASGRLLPAETDRLEIIGSGRTGVGTGFYTVRRTVTSADVQNGVAIVTLQMPIGMGHVVAAEAYDAANQLLVVGSTTVQFGGSPAAQAYIYTYRDRALGAADPLPGEVIAFARSGGAATGWTIVAVDPEGQSLGVLSTPVGTSYLDPALSPGAIRAIYRTSDWDILQSTRGQTTSTNLTTLYPETGGRHLAWSRQGDRIAFISADDIWVALPDGSMPVQLRDTPEKEQHPSFSPDGREICFHLDEDDEGRGNVGIIKSDGTNWRIITTDLTAASTDWSPKGDEIIFHQAQEQPQDAQGNDVPDDGTLFVVDTAGANVTQIDLDEDDKWANSSPRWSIDGEEIVFVRDAHPDDDETDLWIFERQDVTTLEQLTDTPTQVERAPFWR